MNTAPPLRVLVVALVAFVVTVAGAVVLLVSSPQLLAAVTAHAAAIGAGLLAAVPALAAWLTGRQVRATQSAHAAQLAEIGDNTNGRLDARIETGVTRVLIRAGLIPDEPPAVIPIVIPDQPTPQMRATVNS